MTLSQFTTLPDEMEARIKSRLALFDDQSLIEKIWHKDHTVWDESPDEIVNRLGWLDIASRMRTEIAGLEAFTQAIIGEEYADAVLLGMGGSSLAPDVFRTTFQRSDPFLRLHILDSTDPGAIIGLQEKIQPQKTLFIVSTKSGGTVETLSFFKYFYNFLLTLMPPEETGKHFIAITDPSSKLERIAEQHHFRKTFLNDPEIGGRYSALSFFGLVPAALAGINLQTLLKRTLAAEEGCSPGIPTEENLGALLGAFMGEAALLGKDKLTFVLSEKIASLGDWLEQLIAESTGKEGKGILPVVGETTGQASDYGNDRAFIQIALGDDEPGSASLEELAQAGHPLFRLRFTDCYDLGIIMFLFEFATAVAGNIIRIQPFDQPDVEAAKVLARKAVAAYQETGKLPEEQASIAEGDIRILGEARGATLNESIKMALNDLEEGDYIAIHAYMTPDDVTSKALQQFRMALRDRTRLATTVGYGPRFLHSTGQLHKGDGGNGFFIRLTADMPADLPIPDEIGSPDSGISFGILKTAQLIGDTEALLEKGRRVLRIQLGADAASDLSRLAKFIP